MHTTTPAAVTFGILPGVPVPPLAARPDPDLTGYETIELAASGLARAFDGDPCPRDGRWSVRPGDVAPFTTRVLVRRPTDPTRFSGTVVVEWLNVSSGADASPSWTFLAEEIVRRGHAWAGVSAQHVGVCGGPPSVDPDAVASAGLRSDPRYESLTHPGDAFSYDIFGTIAASLTLRDGPLEDLHATVVLALGESQSAMCLTTYLNAVHPLSPVFDGFLLHSRARAGTPLSGARGFDLTGVLGAPAALLRDDLEQPVLVLATEGDLLGRIGFAAARQPDHHGLRTWEVAGAAHADHYVIGDVEAVLGCEGPVNRGQQAYVARAALAHLDTWVRGGDAPPSSDPIGLVDGVITRDTHGIAVGGVRTPVVDAPADVVSGETQPGASITCQLFGSTRPLPPGAFEALYANHDAYLAAYAAATESAIAAGVVLAEDRGAVLAEAR